MSGAWQDRWALHAQSAAAESIRRNVVLASAVTALGGLLFGYDTGVVSGALLFLKNDFGGLSSFQQELVTSLLLVGAAVGALFAGGSLTVSGGGPRCSAPRWSSSSASCSPRSPPPSPCCSSPGSSSGSRSVPPPWSSRSTSGTEPPSIRGGLVSLNQLAITSGILVSYLADYWLSDTKNWRLMFGLAAIPAVLLFVGMLFQSESPHWLVMRGRDDDARRVVPGCALPRRSSRRSPRCTG